MDCSKCLDKCKAQCCGIVPLPISLFTKYKPVREIIEVQSVDNKTSIYLTKDSYCPFLGKDFRCTVYADRPEVCKKFGDESHLMMTCKWQSKSGEIRQRAERRQIERQIDKYFERFKSLNK